ncbi:MAG TPA: type II toxin-antitoxin system HicA family toxin, partial [Tepidiformaceae bacterium]|nr:type II toxin-antitoxin system HicA family toxin [Tepidiformaceae bacterium]
MAKPLPVVSGRAARRAFERAGWRFDRQRGSHMILTKDGVPVNLSIPDHRELFSIGNPLRLPGNDVLTLAGPSST